MSVSPVALVRRQTQDKSTRRMSGQWSLPSKRRRILSVNVPNNIINEVLNLMLINIINMFVIKRNSTLKNVKDEDENSWRCLWKWQQELLADFTTLLSRLLNKCQVFVAWRNNDILRVIIHTFLCFFFVCFKLIDLTKPFLLHHLRVHNKSKTH